MPATIQGVHLGPGDHASRPAANAAGQPVGALYSCTDHSLIYKTDGSSWSTYATLGVAASGSITASGYTQSTARLLGRTTASSGAIEEISVGAGLTLSAGSLATSGSAGSYVYTTEIVAGAGGIASMDFTSIAGTGRHLVIEAMLRAEKNAAFDDLRLTVNGLAGTNYDFQSQSAFQTTNSAAQSIGAAFWGVIGQPAGATATAGLFSYYKVIFPYYASTTYRKVGYLMASEITANLSGSILVRHEALFLRSTAAITQVTFVFAGGDVAEGSSGSLYLIN